MSYETPSGPPFADYEHAREYLINVLPDQDRNASGIEGLFRDNSALLNELGNPQNETKAVHVAGTSGKGSTTYYISALLASHKFKTVTLISPHVYDIRERAMIDLSLIDCQTFTELAGEVVNGISRSTEKAGQRSSFTAALVGLGFLACRKVAADYVVVETVLGGRFDTTNAIDRDDKYAVITSLGMDHEQRLGSSPEQIAWHKAGIMRPNGKASAFLPDSPSVMNVLNMEAKSKNCSISYVDPFKVASGVNVSQEGIVFDYYGHDTRMPGIELATLGSYQVKNAVLALDSLYNLADRDSFDIDESSVRNALSSLHIPARMELRDINQRRVIIDSATNPQKLSHLVEALNDAGIKKPVWVFGTGKGKAHRELFAVLREHASGIVFSEYFNNSADYLKGKCTKAEDLRKIWQAMTDVPCIGEFSDVNQAFDCALENTLNVPIVIAGSIYMIGEFYR